MTKDDIHNTLKSFSDSLDDELILTSTDFVNAYGNDDDRSMKEVSVTRAKILARVYGLSVKSTDKGYVFERTV